MKNNTKRLIALFLLVASLHSCIAFSADGKDLHNPNDPFLHWSGGQPVMIPLPLLEQNLPSSISREEREERERLLHSIEQSQAGLDISQYQLELAERLRQEGILQPATSSSTSSSSSTISKRRLEEDQERIAKIR